MNFVTASITFLTQELQELPTAFPEQLNTFLNQQNIRFSEEFNDIALRDRIDTHMVPIMEQFFTDRLVTCYFSHMFQNKSFKSDDHSFPKYMFIKTNRQEFYEFPINETETLYIGDIDYFHRESSALANALGLVLNQRDNYPGGKQKIGFKFIDISWSALQSKLPLVIY